MKIDKHSSLVTITQRAAHYQTVVLTILRERVGHKVVAKIAIRLFREGGRERGREGKARVGVMGRREETREGGREEER